MRIEDVITEVIIAVYGSPRLAKLLILKGGSAMRMFDGQDTRLSIDADFSIKDALTNADPVFLETEDCQERLPEMVGGMGVRIQIGRGGAPQESAEHATAQRDDSGRLEFTQDPH